MKSQIERIADDREEMKFFQQERLILDATERICEMMKEQGVSRKRLADLLGKSKSYITQLLDGERNMTLRTLSDVFFEMGFAVNIETGSLEETTRPLELSIDIECAKWTDVAGRWDTSELEGSENFATEEIAA